MAQVLDNSLPACINTHKNPNLRIQKLQEKFWAQI